MLDVVQPFFLSFIIGLLIGIERERRHAHGVKSIGMRTFILFSLLGTLAAYAQKPLLTMVLGLFIFSLLLLSYYRTMQLSQKQRSVGMTTEMAAAAVFMLGYIVLQQRALAVTLGVVVMLILLGRESLHRFARKRLTAKEIEAAITILIISIGIVSFLPDKTIDPWHLFNPQNFGIIVLVLASLQFGGYISIRLFGEQLGMIFVGFLGGFVSSTAVFASLSQAKKRSDESIFSGVVAGIFATIATLIAFLIVILVASPTLIQYIFWPVVTIIAIGCLSSWWFMHKKAPSSKKIAITYPNPLDIITVIKMALVIMGILLLVGLTKQYIGRAALPYTAFIAGLFDIHGLAYAIALLFNDQTLSMKDATQLLAIAICASFISKFALVWIIAHNRFALVISLFLLIMLAGGSGIYFLALPYWMP